MKTDQLTPVVLPGFPYSIFQAGVGQTVTQDTQYLLDTILDHYPVQALQVLELGSGTGILSILMKLNRPTWQITGIEIQTQLVDLSILNAANCNIKVKFIEGDIRQITDYLPLNEFDLIIGNPPYFKKGENRLSPNREKAISRHEIMCTMDDILIAITKTLKSDGKAFLLYPPNRLEEMKQKIKNIDLQLNHEFSLSKMNNNKDKSVIVELAYADH